MGSSTPSALCLCTVIFIDKPQICINQIHIYLLLHLCAAHYSGMCQMLIQSSHSFYHTEQPNSTMVTRGIRRAFDHKLSTVAVHIDHLDPSYKVSITLIQTSSIGCRLLEVIYFLVIDLQYIYICHKFQIIRLSIDNIVSSNNYVIYYL